MKKKTELQKAYDLVLKHLRKEMRDICEVHSIGCAQCAYKRTYEDLKSIKDWFDEEEV